MEENNYQEISMQTEIVIAGFGGQGALFAGQILAYAAMDAGKEVTWIPSYGPEMRGGTANCTVIIADEEIGSPLVRHPRAVIAMNLPSLDKYEHLIIQNGTIIINSSFVNRPLNRNDLHSVAIPANDIAETLGEKRMSNIVMLGALIASLPVLTLMDIEQSIINHLPKRHLNLLPSNIEALKLGAQFVEHKEIV
jgi:2-oxoglutarate ferredoxin oxidoreductase subunit gamma